MLGDVVTQLAHFADPPLAGHAWVHLGWVACAMSVAAAIAIPTGVLASRSALFERAIRRVCDAILSVPALAWLGVCAALLDSGVATLCFLVVCTAPPLVRGILDGIRAIDPDLADLGVALGLPAPARVRVVTAPMMLPSVFVGLRDAVTYSSAAVTVAGIAGAGGFGGLIVEGLLVGQPSSMLIGGAAAAALTFALRLAVAAGQRLTPPLWGARKLHAGGHTRPLEQHGSG